MLPEPIEQQLITDREPESIVIDQDEVAELIESIKESEYFDAKSMAPLSPASVVSLSLMLLIFSTKLYLTRN